MENITKSAAQIAREHNISPQLLRNRIKKGMSIEAAVKECINVRDARAASGSAPHKSSRPGQGEIEFAGETYASFSAACQALGLRESSAYAKRKRLMDNGYSMESASRTVLEEAAKQVHRCPSLRGPHLLSPLTEVRIDPRTFLPGKSSHPSNL